MTETGSRRRLPALGAGLGGLLIAVAACTSAASSSPSAAASVSAAASMASETAMASPSEDAAGPTITIANTTSFGESEITVPAGQKLTVVNASTFPHTFTEGENGEEAANARVNEEIAEGATVEIDFPESGDYNITCLFHQAMNIVVHVE
jgi:plastocyanin